MSHRRHVLFALATLAVACTEEPFDSSADPGAPAGPYVAASVAAPAGALCDLHADGNLDPRARVRIAADDDGVLRFQARRATIESDTQRLALDCVDAAGRASSAIVDLTADDTFAPRPYDLARAGGADRAALVGDPMSYSVGELVQMGYGLRPDPISNPDGYQRWLRAASIPARLARGNGPTPSQRAALVAKSAGPQTAFTAQPAGSGVQQLPGPRVQSATNNIWVGSVMSGYYGAKASDVGLPAGPGTGSYVSVEASFIVPPVTPGLYGTATSAAHASIWAGLGGWYHPSALIQGGVYVHVDSLVVSYSVMREFCCGLTGDELAYTSPFTPVPDEWIYTQQWYCDANGNPSMTGGYGCSYISEVSTGRVLSCVSPTDTTCASLPFGKDWDPGGDSAEFITELQDPSFPGFAKPISMTGTAVVAFGGGTTSITSNVGTDPKVTLASVPALYGVRLTPNLSTTSSTTTELHTSSAPVLLVVENKCLNAAPISGAAVTLVTCTGGASQRWVFNENGTMSPANVATLCMDLSGGNTANGTPVGLYTCNGGANQKWTYTAQGRLSSVGGKCLDDPGAVTIDGTKLDYWTCNGGANQAFTITSAPRTLVADETIDDTSYKGNRKCIDLPNWKTTDGTRLDLWDCNGGTNQQWVLAGDSTVRSIVDITKCVDVDGTAQGSHVVIRSCNGTPSQRWSESWGWGDGAMFGDGAGMTIDDPNSVLTNGTPLVFWTAHGSDDGTNPYVENQAFKIQ